MNYTRVFLDTEQYLAFSTFATYNGEIVTWDMGPTIYNGRVLSSPDGLTWSALFDALGTDIGNCNSYDGFGICAFDGSLWIALYRSGTQPRIIEWDGKAITQHLKSPAYNNYLAHGLLCWNRRLWCVTDVTPYQDDDRRVVYHWDGASWTAITDYDGATRLTYNKTSGLPAYAIKHRTTRLFVFGNELYLLATRYDSTIAKWVWQVWKFDMANYDNFTKVFDSAVFDDGCALSAVIDDNGTCYVLANELTGGSPTNTIRLYSSRDMVNWTAEPGFGIAVGFPFGELRFEGRCWFNCLQTATNNVEVRYLENGALVLDETITTNTISSRNGGLHEFGGDFYLGKWREIYRAPGHERIQPRARRRPLVALEIDARDYLGETTTHRFAPMDARSPTRFYHGRLKGLSSPRRALDDRTHAFQMTDLTAEFVNTDREFSKLITSRFLKNEEARLYYMFAELPESMRQHVLTLITDDYSLKGNVFTVRFKDFTEQYFSFQPPEHVCTEEEFPNIHPNHVGRAMPEILGLNRVSIAYEHPGAVEAVYVNTAGPPYRCLAANGTVTVLANEVWIADVQKTAGVDYNVTYADGRTYIDFVAGQDPGDDTVAFNASGRSFAAWNSPNGYVQNPAYVVAYYLAFILKVPLSRLDMAYFDGMANYYDARDWGEAGKLLLQQKSDAREVFRELLFSFGVKSYTALDGRIRIDLKDESNYATDLVLFDQVDCLAHPDIQWNLPEAISAITARFNYVPWQDLWLGADTGAREVPWFPEPKEDHIPARHLRI